jgi:hypothetical protein
MPKSQGLRPHAFAGLPSGFCPQGISTKHNGFWLMSVLRWA